MFVADQGQDRDEEDHGQRGASPDVELDERLRVHLVGQHLGAEVAAGHGANDIEQP